MSKKYNEDILVFPTARLHELGWFTNYKTWSAKYEKELFSADSRFQFLDRNLAETDSSFKQLIPYISVKKNDLWLTAQRSKKVGESRLAGLYTNSVGGHVNTTDVDGETNLEPLALVLRGLVREINEELSFSTEVIPQWRLAGFINLDQNEVDKVHFGAHFIIELTDEDVQIIDNGLINHKWMTIEEMNKSIEQFEGWSQVVIREYL